MKSRKEILEEFSLFSVPPGGVGSWITDRTHIDILGSLEKLDDELLSANQMKRLLVMSHEAQAGNGFFRYYWLEVPEEYPYKIRTVPGFSEA